MDELAKLLILSVIISSCVVFCVNYAIRAETRFSKIFYTCVALFNTYVLGLLLYDLLFK
jgi:hypothetical protein